jgi:hypothetical protein
LQNSHQEINKEMIYTFIREQIFSIKCHKVFMTFTLGRQIKVSSKVYFKIPLKCICIKCIVFLVLGVGKCTENKVILTHFCIE